MQLRHFVVVIALGLSISAGLASGQSPAALPVSASGPYFMPEQAPCQDCISHRCKLVPETKQIKKTVYEVQEVPYCLKKLPPLFSFHRHGCDDSAECDCVRYKKVLVKKEIVCCEIPTTKCVPEACVPK